MANPFDSAASSISSFTQQAGSNPNLGSGNIGQQVGAFISNLSDPSKLLSSIRSKSLPIGGNPVGNIMRSAATFGGADANSDWRVRLTVPGGTIFDSSPVFKPLKEAGGLVFPYTPQINIGASAKYDTITPVHNNYPFQAYQSSAPDQISIIAPFLVENSAEAQYWIATVHFLRAASKMFTGDSTPAGNPPVILALNGYGEYVFKNVPVVLTNFTVTLDAASDYISTIPSAAGASALSSPFSQAAGVLSSVATAQNAKQKVESIIGAAKTAKSILTNNALGANFSGPSSHVPTKSSFTITLQPIYSRESVRTFSLNKFVNGDYMTSSGSGYI
jgi:hypothetical protein